jgi:hypothetical protein
MSRSVYNSKNESGSVRIGVAGDSKKRQSHLPEVRGKGEGIRPAQPRPSADRS